jgi:hypothetical protein
MLPAMVRIRNYKEVKVLEVNLLEDEIKGFAARTLQHL